MDRAGGMKAVLGFRFGEVVPTATASPPVVVGIPEGAAALLKSILRASNPAIIGMGTGRAMRAAVEQVPAMDCPDHQLVSLVGNISPDGSASFFDTVARLADLTKARHYPMPLPVFVSSEAEREELLQINPVSRIRAIAETAELRLVGVGQIDQGAQLFVDGFINREELLELMRLGAVGELIGWAFDG